MAKRIIAGLLTLVLLFTAVPVTGFAAGTEEQASVDTGEVSIEGTNGFGTLLSQEIAESEAETAEAEASYEAGYTVTDLVIEGTTATVTYDSMEEALLVVALYTEDGMQMVTSATATVTADATEATVEFTGEMPEYFLASAYLVDTYDLSPLCASYDTPMYTQEMQELLASTVEDYDADRVLNLDDDNTTNFAVYAETTKVIEAAEGVNTVASIDDENATYIIENADEQITSLAAGDVFVYPYAENEILIVKVATITIDGTTVTITGGELEMEEAFAAVKIEGTDSTENMVVDDSTADDGVTYEGISAPMRVGTMSPMSDEVSVQISKSAKFKIDKDVVSKADGDVTVNVAGSVEFAVKAELSYYVSATRQFVEFRIEKSVTGAITVTGKLEHEWKLCDAALYPVPGVGIGLEPTFKIEVSGEIEFSITLSGTIGFTYDAKYGLKPLFTAPNFDPDVKAECTIFMGFDLNPQVEIAEGYLAEFAIELPIGLEFKITRTGNGGVEPTENDLIYHTCVRCLDLEVFFKVEVTVKLQFLKCEWLKIEGTLIKEKDGLGHAYFSFDEVELGLGLCPYLTHRLTVIVTDSANNPVAGAAVTADGQSQQTNSNGIAVFYLPEGAYTIQATSGEMEKSKKITIDRAQKVTIRLVEDADEEIGLADLLDMLITAAITDTITVAETTYNGNTYRLIDSHMTWTEAEEYCESLGGHLVTITSAEEQAAIETLMEYGSKIQYWIGMQYINGAHQWVTGESVTFTNWDIHQPDRCTYGGEFEDYIQIYNAANSNTPGSKRFKWNDAYCDNFFRNDLTHNFSRPAHVGLICEFEGEPEHEVNGNGSENGFSPNAVYPGDYSTEVTDTYVLKTASFIGLVTDEQYVLLAMKSIEVEDPLAADNLLFIDQGVALEDGTLSFQYVQRETVDISYVVACGASNKDLHDAEITFPEMTADGARQVVAPTVVYDGVTLTEGRDYVIVGTVDFTEGGTYTCYIRGIHNYTGLVECVYTVTTDSAVIASGSCGEALTWTLTETGLLTISGMGAMADFAREDAPWYDVREQIVTVVMEDGAASVGSYAFYGCKNITSVRLSNGLTSIGDYAFYYCRSLTGIEIPDTVGTIGVSAFAVSGLTSIAISGNIEVLGIRVFQSCVNLTCADLQYAGTVTAEMFSGCSRLTDLTFGTGITGIGESGFAECSALEYVAIPAGIAAIGDNAFAGCGELKGFTVESGNPAFCASDGILYTKDMTKLVTVPGSYSSEFIIPECVLRIAPGAFSGCADLTGVTFHDGMLSIGSSAFRGCVSLTAVEIPEGITSIPFLGFCGCVNLEQISLPESLREIRQSAFSGCTNLKEISLPAGLQQIGRTAFQDCTSLGKLLFTGDAPSIAADAFSGVTANVYYPRDNDSWTSDIMQDYGGAITWMTSGGPETVATGWSGYTTWVLTSDGTLTFSGEGNMKNYGYGDGQPWAEYADQITTVVIEEGVTAVGSGAFRNMTALESVTLPASGLSKIGEAAFYGCTGLKEIYIPDGVYTIWEYTFKNCTSLTSIRLPATLVKVDQGAFEACTGLTGLFIPGNTEIIGAWSFKGCTGLTSVDMQWADATEIRAGAFKNCTALANVILPTDIQILGDSAFYGIGAASFTIPATVTEVGPWCFARAALAEVTFQGNAPAIGEGAFNKIALTAYYPGDNATWTADLMQNYGGNITWKAN